MTTQKVRFEPSLINIPTNVGHAEIVRFNETYRVDFFRGDSIQPHRSEFFQSYQSAKDFLGVQ